MAKTKIITNLEYPKPKTKSSLCLCFFGSSASTSVGSTNNIGSREQRSLKQKSWFPWQRIGKTVPLLEGLEFDEKKKKKKKKHPKLKVSYNKVQYSSSKWRSKSNLHNKYQQAHPTPTPTQKQPLIPHIAPNQPPSNSQFQTSQPNRENKALENETCQQSGSSPTIAAATATSHSDLGPASKRHVQRMGPQTTPKQHGKHQNANRQYSPVVGAWAVIVTLVILLLWGRLCAIVCTSTWLYFVHRFRLVQENDVVVESSKELDLDSNLYKKKVVLEGLLERNHSCVL
ncbi:uncharacterized protein LOC130967649 isoform X1 [Arachis stenosperma]|uniref:uncharacterized protein LOC130967649 isoform X1 n=1 Tax=Arachis stenosperma TaxID=217475 RepID=UPI0025AB6FAD|nr:uncharacterized protein LOC130967649 isoform X1 [Arachis stenosperma]